MFLWNSLNASVLDANSLGSSLGMTVRSGDLPILGVATSSEAANGDGRKYAAAVALALAGLTDDRQAVDFLHSRLAPVVKRSIPRWAILAAVAVVALIALIVAAYTSVQNSEKRVDDLNNSIASKAAEQKAAQAFVTTVSLAQAWHLGSPRYVMCLRDLLPAIPQDGQTYAMSLNLQEKPEPPQTQSGSSTATKAPVTRYLSGRLDFKTTDLQHIQEILDGLKARPNVFTDVENVGSQSSGKLHELSFSITFTYIPPK
jgi:hypothetical protein